MRKKSFTLIEISIALSLCAIVFSFLFSTFTHLVKEEITIRKLKEAKDQEHLIWLRLNRVFQSVEHQTPFTIEPYNDRMKEALHFTFDYGIDPDPKFCGQVEGFLGVDDEDTFCLHVEPKKGEGREEVFAFSAKNYQLLFLNPKDGTWQSQWEQETLPPLIKVSLDAKEYVFTLPFSNYEVNVS